MNATFSPEQNELSRIIKDITSDGVSQAKLCTPEAWVEPSQEQTLLENFGSLGIPEELGGIGGDLIDVVVAVEAAGQSVYPSRFIPQLAALHLASTAGIDVSPATQGGQKWSIATDETNSFGELLVATKTGLGSVGTTKVLVPFASDADNFVVLGNDGVCLLSAHDVTPSETIDYSRPTGTVTFNSVPTQLGANTSGHLRAMVIAAAELCGVARGAVRLGAEFAKVREQFGQPIGARQGVAFQLSEAQVGVKAAWDLTVYAAWAAQSGHSDAHIIVAQAKERAGRSAIFAAERAIQVHGGMGITYEANPHLFLRRAMFNDTWLGSGIALRRQIGKWRMHNWASSETLKH
jgi:alkylation response protein AidB-like acyl-CoA dehydrogenase